MCSKIKLNTTLSNSKYEHTIIGITNVLIQCKFEVMQVKVNLGVHGDFGNSSIMDEGALVKASLPQG